MSKAFLSLLSIILAVFIGFSCQVAEPNNDQSLSITVEDVSCTETWIKISAKGIDADKQLMLYRNNEYLTAFTMDKADTLFFDEGLLPSKTYNYKAKLGGFTAMAEAVTMDTTSHDFTWETFTFGNRSSVLKDVAIINENNIWAVGEIHTEETDQFDSNGVWVQPYNAVHWNGTSWELRRIMFYIDQDQPTAGRTSAEGKSIFVFEDSKFAVTSNVQTAIFNSNEEYSIIKMGFNWEDRFTINAMWGTSSKDFYVVGNNGNIAHYDGSPSGTGWKKIESGTEERIQDIWGARNNKTEDWDVLCALSPGYGIGQPKILKIHKDKTVENIPWVEGRAVRSVWFNNKLITFACGSGVFRRTIDRQWREIAGIDVLNAATERIRGQAINDIFVVGDFGAVMHFNGHDFQLYPQPSTISYESCDYKNDILIAVGYNGSHSAEIIKMKR
ncbi:MAG: hypothetical protein ABIJ40_01130 [Bacteroidota bacterium]